MPRAGFTVAVLCFVAALSVACDMDPHRIGVEYTDQDEVVIHLANCDNYQVHRVALSFSGERESPLWEVTAIREAGDPPIPFIVGQAPDGFRETIALTRQLSNRRYLAVIDSSFLEGQSYSFDWSDLRRGQVLVRDGDYVTREAFRAGALCN